MFFWPRIIPNVVWHLKFIKAKPCIAHIQKDHFRVLYQILNVDCYLNMASNRYCVDLAKRGTAGCKNCNKKIDKGVLRIGKIIPNPFTESGSEMKQWFHVPCIFDKLSRARATTKKIESTDDLEGWDDLTDEHKIEVSNVLSASVSSPKKTQKPSKSAHSQINKKDPSVDSPSKSSSTGSGNQTGSSKDDTLREFRKLCTKISDESSYTGKTSIVSQFFSKGSDESGFKGNLFLWVKLLLPNVDKRVYNLQNKQLVKLFSEMFQTSQDEMLEHLEQGDVAETVRVFFECSETFLPEKKSTLTLQEVDALLDSLAYVSKEAEQSHLLTKIAKRCTGNDLKMINRMIKHDLRINAGPKHILEAIHPTAYEAFQASRNLHDIVMRCEKQNGGKEQSQLQVQTSLMTPVLPMLAMACHSAEEAFKRFPEGFYAEIKYDGERVQLHKRGQEFSYFSRSLKPVMPYKVAHLKEFIPKAFRHGNNLILDCEILLVNNDGKPLPFGTLGAHKKTAFKDATVCLFVFDCLLFNDENLMKRPLIERRKILQENMTSIPKHIVFSEMTEIQDLQELKDIIHSVIQQGLEGIVIKNKMGVYEPGKRHWLKLKKDYLEKNYLNDYLSKEDSKKKSLVDTADLVVLGAYYGTGNKGGMKSIFLMGCYDERKKKWCTVTKVHGGHSDAALERLQEELKMTKISKDASKVPSWLIINKSLVPDFVSDDPKLSPVWEITGAEFSKAEAHTANGISIRFPRVTRIRDDKTWKEATNLQELQHLYDVSKEAAELVGLKALKKGNGNDVISDVNDDKVVSTSRKKTPKTKNREPTIQDHSPIKKRKVDVSSDSGFETSLTQTSEDGLPSIFTGIKLFIPPTLDQADVLRRYFLAFDGHLLKAHEKDEANIMISSADDDNVPKNAKIVTVDWLWACIKLKKLLPADDYKPNT